MDAPHSGWIHSTESFGTVDGPGIRFVVFFQGCPLRCRYCHNPDTWSAGQGQQMSVEEIIGQMKKNQAFYANGGLTASGGEPLMQPEFLLSLFSAAKAAGFHTCLDTSGAVFRKDSEELVRKTRAILEQTDLVMLDLKQMDSLRHRELTGSENQNILDFARLLESMQKPLWVRHVVVPGVTDDPESLQALGVYLASLSNLKALDMLPYHTLGVEKYKALDIPYTLEGIPPLSKAALAAARKEILKAYKSEKFRLKQEAKPD